MNRFTAIENKVIKLSNGKLVDTENLEREISRFCHYVQHVVIAQKDEKYTVAIIFPKIGLLTSPDYEKSPEEGCFCPRSLNELGKCLSGCLHTLNLELKSGYSKIDSAVIIKTELSIENKTLSPSSSAIASNVIAKYKAHLNNLYGDKVPVTEEAYSIKLNQ